MADERVRQLETDRLALLVRKARLEHQRDEATNFMIPQLVGFEIGNVNFMSVYASENDTFMKLVEAYHNQLKALQEQGPRIEAEIQAVNAQIDDVKQRLGIVSERLAEYEDYAARGYVRRTRSGRAADTKVPRPGGTFEIGGRACSSAAEHG